MEAGWNEDGVTDTAVHRVPLLASSGSPEKGMRFQLPLQRMDWLTRHSTHRRRA